MEIIMCSIETLIQHYPELSFMQETLGQARDAILDRLSRGGKVLLAGNGGSAADCDHIVGELMKGFLLPRTPEGEEMAALAKALGPDAAGRLQRGIPAVSLTAHAGLLSAYANDCDPELVYAQSLYALGQRDDVLIALSTSGHSRNVLAAVRVARARGVYSVALTGRDGGALAREADVALIAPAQDTYRIQEYHLPIYHALCAELERALFA